MMKTRVRCARDYYRVQAGFTKAAFVRYCRSGRCEYIPVRSGHNIHVVDSLNWQSLTTAWHRVLL
ncbi:hypothetical protein [Marinospirillum sp.]|uniref:hypothetical protein n=1 Tax=Marinospirillum sp. TaxID=2183934 RepID=UPI00286FD5F7|nr:hypothetical protein [Marinospirillum sp.]MDR9466801.1 hypothetical protein [Marinospirillum sp.]